MEHSHFEELAVLAATSQIHPEQLHELREHISVCAQCSTFFDDINAVGRNGLAQLAAERGGRGHAEPSVYLRQAFIERARNEGLRLTPGPAVENVPVANPPIEASRQFKLRNLITARFAILFTDLPAAAALAAICVLCVGIGYVTAVRRSTHEIPNGSVPTSNARAIVPPPSPLVSAANQESVHSDLTDLQQQLNRTQISLSNSEAARNSLEEQVTALKDQAVRNVAQQKELDEKSAALRIAEQQAVDAAAEVKALQAKLAMTDSILAAQQQATVEVSAKLDRAQQQIDRTQDMERARSSAGDLVAARNLHIVDVYDSNPAGNRQKPFGRVFYIEGKSLVFYAYDLDDARQLKANIVFHVWGGKAGTEQVTHNLGILRKDADISQNRWAMTIDDPKVLAQINSVFVTAEPANKQYEAPHGKKILFAYFGSQPNHP